MKHTHLLSLGLILLLALPAVTIAVSIGEEAVTLNSSGNFTILPENSLQPYIIHENSALGALNAAAEAGGFNYTVSEDLPAEQGILTVTSIAGTERGTMNDTENAWVLRVNAEEISAGPASVQLNDGDSVVYSYGPVGHAVQNAEYTLNISVNVTEPGTVGNQTTNMTLVDVIGQNENLTTLAQAISAANLTGALQTGGPYTVFAPNDEAFQALGNDTIGALLNDTANLTMILQYHVVEGNYTSGQLLMMLQNQTVNQTDNMTQNQTMDQNMTPQQATITLQTLLGENLTVSLNQTTNEVMVNNASVIQPDLNAGNGVVHIVDRVLMPDNVTPTASEAGIVTPNAPQPVEIAGSSSDLTIINRTM